MALNLKYLSRWSGWLGSLAVRALDSRLDGRHVAGPIPGHCNKYWDGWLSLGRQATSVFHQDTQPPTLSEAENEYQPKCSNTLQLGVKGRYGSFHLWINVWVAGKTVWSLINMCHIWATRDEQLIITTTTTVLKHFFRDHLGEPVPEENFFTLWRKGRLIEQGLTSHWTHYRSYRGRVFTSQMTQPTVSKCWRKQ